MEQEFDSPRAVEQPQLVASSSEKAMAASPRRADHLMPWEVSAADAGANNETPLQGLFFMFKTIDLPRQAQDKHRESAQRGGVFRSCGGDSRALAAGAGGSRAGSNEARQILPLSFLSLPLGFVLLCELKLTQS
jgi:hypothetical protein